MKGENKMSKLFKQGDLIRRITEEGDGEIVCVLVDMEYSSESVHVELEKIKGQERKYTYVDPSDYELVTDGIYSRRHLYDVRTSCAILN